MNIDKLSNLGAAKRYADKCLKPHMVILGCDGLFWVVSFRNAQRLVKEGYELAR